MARTLEGVHLHVEHCLHRPPLHHLGLNRPELGLGGVELRQLIATMLLKIVLRLGLEFAPLIAQPLLVVLVVLIELTQLSHATP